MMGEFNYKMSALTPIVSFDTAAVFDKTYNHSADSAIDDFAQKRKDLFTLTNKYVAQGEAIPQELGNLLFLGLVSAVESYLRKVFRLIIHIDKISETKCEDQVVKFGSVLSHDGTDLLAESLMEDMSFAGGYNIKKAIETLLGIKCIKSQEEPFKKALQEFSNICELRHCIVHRFGLLGSHNAIKLGLVEHLECVEKPIALDFSILDNITEVCNNTVKVINNFLFCKILERTFVYKSVSWTFDFRKDKKVFMQYYSIFKDSTNTDKPVEVYKAFIDPLIDKYGRHYFVT